LDVDIDRLVVAEVDNTLEGEVYIQDHHRLLLLLLHHHQHHRTHHCLLE
jgi:hypothetical protein